MRKLKRKLTAGSVPSSPSSPGSKASRLDDNSDRIEADVALRVVACRNVPPEWNQDARSRSLRPALFYKWKMGSKRRFAGRSAAVTVETASGGAGGDGGGDRDLESHCELWWPSPHDNIDEAFPIRLDGVKMRHSGGTVSTKSKHRLELRVLRDDNSVLGACSADVSMVALKGRTDTVRLRVPLTVLDGGGADDDQSQSSTESTTTINTAGAASGEGEGGEAFVELEGRCWWRKLNGRPVMEQQNGGTGSAVGGNGGGSAMMGSLGRGAGQQIVVDVGGLKFLLGVPSDEEDGDDDETDNWSDSSNASAAAPPSPLLSRAGTWSVRERRHSVSVTSLDDLHHLQRALGASPAELLHPRRSISELDDAPPLSPLRRRGNTDGAADGGERRGDEDGEGKNGDDEEEAEGSNGGAGNEGGATAVQDSPSKVRTKRSSSGTTTTRKRSGSVTAIGGSAASAAGATKLAKLRERYDRLRAKHGALKKELRQQVADAERDSAALERVESRLEEATTDLRKHRVLVADARQSRDVETQRANKLQAEVDDLKRQLHGEDGDGDGDGDGPNGGKSHETPLQRARRELDELRDKMVTMTDVVEATKSEMMRHKEATEQLTAENKTVAAERSQLEVQCADFKQQVETERTRATTAEDAVREARSQAAAAQAAVEAAEQAGEQTVEEKAAEVMDLRVRIGVSEQAAKDAREELATTKERLEAARGEAEQLRVRVGVLSAVETNRDELKVERDALRQERDELADRVRTVESSVQSARTESSAVQLRCTQTESELEQERRRAGELEAAVETAESRAAQSDMAVERLRSDVESARDDAVAARGAEATALSARDAAVEAAAAAEAKLAEQTQETAAVREQCQRAEQERTDAEASRDELQSELDERTAECQQLRTDLDARIAECGQLHDRVAALSDGQSDQAAALSAELDKVQAGAREAEEDFKKRWDEREGKLLGMAALAAEAAENRLAEVQRVAGEEMGEMRRALFWASALSVKLTMMQEKDSRVELALNTQSMWEEAEERPWTDYMGFISEKLEGMRREHDEEAEGGVEDEGTDGKDEGEADQGKDKDKKVKDKGKDKDNKKKKKIKE